MICVVLAGVGAGTINTIVGSGTLITFPTLLFFGVPPVVANMSNNIGLVPGGLAGTYGYRRELAGLRATVLRLVPLSAAGGVTGAVLLRVLDPAAFRAIVPVLIALGVVLVFLGPHLSSWLPQAGPAAAADDGMPRTPGRRAALGAGVFGAGVYGGYFGAAQGVLLMGLLSTLTSAPIQRLNGVKNVLATLVNTIAAVVFVLLAFGQIRWDIAALIGVGSLAGGHLGATVGRRLPPNALRIVIAIVGVAGIVKIVWFS
jgi:uncharacterized membrane protein YfcA